MTWYTKLFTYPNTIKRLFDFSISLVVLVLISPLLALIALLLKCVQGQVIFTQERPGKDLVTFRVFKFCTMNNRRDERGQLLEDEERVTAIGRILRRWSLDELPQLLNVLKGDMSLVGPRPQIRENIQGCTPLQLRRQNVRPGITGLAQIKGRNHLSWEQRFKYDVFYVEKISPALDIFILFQTVFKVIGAEGVEYQGRVADNMFQGRMKEVVQEQ